MLVENISHEKWLDFQENECKGDTHFHTNSFAQRLVLPQRQKSTIRPWAGSGSLWSFTGDIIQCYKIKANQTQTKSLCKEISRSCQDDGQQRQERDCQFIIICYTTEQFHVNTTELHVHVCHVLWNLNYLPCYFNFSEYSVLVLLDNEHFTLQLISGICLTDDKQLGSRVIKCLDEAWRKIQFIALFCWLRDGRSRLRSDCLACDQNLLQTNFFPGLKIATLGMKTLCLFLKILPIFCEHCPVSLYKT